MKNMTEIDPRVIEFAHQIFDLARGGDADQIGTLVDAGVPVDLADARGNTILMLAAYAGQAAVVSALILRGADVNRLNMRGQSPLAGAIFKGEDDIARLLIAAGADLDLGTPSARDTAGMFGRLDLLESNG